VSGKKGPTTSNSFCMFQAIEHTRSETQTNRLAFQAEAETEGRPGRIRMRSQRGMSSSNHDGR
jgi:hypothetical protein